MMELSVCYGDVAPAHPRNMLAIFRIPMAEAKRLRRRKCGGSVFASRPRANAAVSGVASVDVVDALLSPDTNVLRS